MKFTIIAVFLAVIAVGSPAKSKLGAWPWSTKDADIVDANGNIVKLAGVNWFGMETNVLAPHGLWSVNYKDLLKQIADHGYNSLRLPFSNDLLKNPTSQMPTSINYYANPELEGLTSLQILDAIIDEAGLLGLKVMLDRHRPDSNGQSELWYSPSCSETQYIEGWKFLAARYKGNPVIVAADLHNEPHGAATWGSGDSATDWRLAAERVGNAIHEINPEWLIVVEGVGVFQNNSYWWGGNLRGARDFPVRLNQANKLVYSVHEYPEEVAQQPWFQDPTFPANMPALYDETWGYLLKKKIAPVIVG